MMNYIQKEISLLRTSWADKRNPNKRNIETFLRDRDTWSIPQLACTHKLGRSSPSASLFILRPTACCNLHVLPACSWAWWFSPHHTTHQVTCTSRVLCYLRSLTRRLGDKSNDESDLPKRVDQCYSLILDGASRSQPPESTEDAKSESLIPRPNDKRSEHNDPVPPRGEKKVHSPFSKYFVTFTRSNGTLAVFLGVVFCVQMKMLLQNSNIFKSQREFSTSRKCNGPVIWDTVNTIKASVGDYAFSWVYWLAHGFYHLAIDGLYVKWVLYFHHLAIRRPGANWSNICTIRRAEEGWLGGLIVKSRVIATWETMLPIATVSRFLFNTIFNPFSSKRYGEMYFGETKKFRTW